MENEKVNIPNSFILPRIDFSTRNSGNFAGNINQKGLIHDKKNFYDFSMEDENIVHLKKISYEIVDKRYNGGDPKEDCDVWSAYVELMWQLKENVQQEFYHTNC